MIRSSVGFSIMALCVKLASPELPSLEIVFFRSLFGSLMLLGVMIPGKVPFAGTHRKTMALRGISGFIALSLFFTTIGHLPIGTAVILNYTSPILAAVFAVFFLHERPSIFLALLTLSAFAGVFLLAGGSLLISNFYFWTGLLSSVFAAFAYVFISSVKGRENPMTIIFYFTSISTIGSLFYLPFGFVWPSPLTWLYLMGVGVGSFYGQLWMTMSLQRAPATLVSPFFYVSPLLSFIYGMIFFKDPLTLASLIGGVLILISGCLITFSESKRSQVLTDE